MSAVGKILVFLNLVFAFVVAAFAILDYTARTNWANKYETLKKSYEVVEADSQTWEKKAKGQSEEIDKFNKAMLQSGPRDGTMDDKMDGSKVAEKVAGILKTQKDTIDKLTDALGKERKRNTDLDKEMLQYKTNAKVAQEGVATRQADNEAVRETLAKVTADNTRLTVGINSMRDRAVAAEIEAKSFKGRNTQLNDKLADMAAQIIRLEKQGGRTATASASGSRNPPPDQVEGLIQRVDGRLVTLTIGSDAGLQKGHTLYVYGMGNTPGYRGQIRLVEVTPKVAVGEVIGKETTRIRVGDTAASDIMPRK